MKTTKNNKTKQNLTKQLYVGTVRKLLPPFGRVGVGFLVCWLLSPFGGAGGGLFAQDMHFSQFTMVPLQLDPSQAGKFGGDNRAIINYRDQWSSVTSSPFRTFGASYDMHFNKNGRKDNFFGGGITAYSDKAGEASLGITVVNLTVAYHIKLDKASYLSAGVQAGFLQSSLSENKLRFDSQFDGSGHNDNFASGENFNNTSFFEPDFAVGVSYTYGNNTTDQVVNNGGFGGKKVNVGAAIHHVASPNFSFLDENTDNLNFRYVLHTNTSFGVGGTNMAVQPSGFIAYQQKAIDVVLGSYFRYNLKEKSKYSQFSNGAAVSFGVHYRFGDAFIPSILVEMGSFAVGVSYDFNLSGLSAASNGQGGYELSIRYVSPNPFGTRKSSARFF
ncbi:MAG: PorP/SprF family type IX secretion system membrane protein [Vicingaceae bacterium]|nr:PorP/SprF family type IX secretion system membrane protein [Vicingaceae bacterium]